METCEAVQVPDTVVVPTPFVSQRNVMPVPATTFKVLVESLTKIWFDHAPNAGEPHATQLDVAAGSVSVASAVRLLMYCAVVWQYCAGVMVVEVEMVEGAVKPFAPWIKSPANIVGNGWDALPEPITNGTTVESVGLVMPKPSFDATPDPAKFVHWEPMAAPRFAAP